MFPMEPHTAKPIILNFPQNIQEFIMVKIHSYFPHVPIFKNDISSKLISIISICVWPVHAHIFETFNVKKPFVI